MTQPNETIASSSSAADASSVIDPSLLETLVCPLTRSKLQLQGQELVATTGGLRYPIREGIPIMLITEAALPQGFATLDEFKQKYAG